MTSTDYIVIGIVAVIIGLAVGYIIKAKKSGRKCIGCPSGSCCCECKTNTAPDCGCNCQGKAE